MNTDRGNRAVSDPMTTAWWRAFQIAKAQLGSTSGGFVSRAVQREIRRVLNKAGKSEDIPPER